jgi:hypothetical protein
MVHGFDYHLKELKAQNGNYKISHNSNLGQVSPMSVEETLKIEKQKNKELVSNASHANKLKGMQLFYPVNTTPTAMNVSINWQ